MLEELSCRQSRMLEKGTGELYYMLLVALFKQMNKGESNSSGKPATEKVNKVGELFPSSSLEDYAKSWGGGGAGYDNGKEDEEDENQEEEDGDEAEEEEEDDNDDDDDDDEEGDGSEEDKK
ncbi:nucleolin-like isoform X3 [Punica granatum]|nr:nucleolin-like isoform X3 [Punica granatum]